MPISGYFQGHGTEVMDDMMKRYGPAKGKSAFYATANAKNMNPEDDRKKKAKKLAAFKSVKGKNG